MKLEEIGFYTLSDKRTREASILSPLCRCELLLTNQCNFSCPYCRGTSSDANISLSQAFKIIDLWAEEGLQNIRFSGGEPTVSPLIEFVCGYAKEKGIKRIAVSTNGSALRRMYEYLLNEGVNDFSISLDACCSSTGDIMSGKDNQWNIIIDNIKYLSSKTYVTVGVVLTKENIGELNNIIKLASDELNVADIRIITSAQWNQFLGNIQIDDKYLNKHPILRYRINNLNNGRDIRGISEADNHLCPLVLDDMAVRGDYHYPCIIKMREGCSPIGKVSSKMRIERLEYYKNHNVFNDFICRKNCLDVCIAYNNKINNLIPTDPERNNEKI